MKLLAIINESTMSEHYMIEPRVFNMLDLLTRMNHVNLTAYNVIGDPEKNVYDKKGYTCFDKDPIRYTDLIQVTKWNSIHDYVESGNNGSIILKLNQFQKEFPNCLIPIEYIDSIFENILGDQIILTIPLNKEGNQNPGWAFNLNWQAENQLWENYRVEKLNNGWIIFPK